MLTQTLAPRTGKKPVFFSPGHNIKPYWVEMIQDLVEGAGFSYSRIAYRIKVSPSTIQKLATNWDRKPRQPVFHRLLCLYHKVFKSDQIPAHVRLYLEQKNNSMSKQT